MGTDAQTGGTVVDGGLDDKGFHLMPRSSCCNAIVVIYRQWPGFYNALMAWEDVPSDAHCGACNRPLSGRGQDA